MPKKQDERRKDMTQGSTRFQVILATLGVAMALLLAALDQTVVGVAMPRIVSDLHGIQFYAWVTTAYLITSTALVPVAGKLGDMFGRKPFMLAGMVGFIAASALCGLSQNMIELVLFRGLQGVFGGVLFASTFAVMTDIFPPEQRARMSGVFGAIFGLSSVIGTSTLPARPCFSPVSRRFSSRFRCCVTTPGFPFRCWGCSRWRPCSWLPFSSQSAASSTR